MSARAQSGSAGAHPFPCRLKRCMRLLHPFAIFPPRIVVLRPNAAGAPEERLHRLALHPSLRRKVRKLYHPIRIKTLFTLALEGSFISLNIRPHRIVPELDVHERWTVDRIVDLPFAAQKPPRVGAMRGLPCRAARKSMCVAAGRSELRKLAADAAHDRRIAPFRPLPCRRPGLIVVRTLHRIAEAIERPVRYHPARTAIIAQRHVHVPAEKALLPWGVIHARRRLSLMDRKPPLPDRLHERSPVQPSGLRRRTVGIHEIGEPRLIAV